MEEHDRVRLTVELPVRPAGSLLPCVGTLSDEAVAEMLAIVEAELGYVEPRKEC